MNDGSLIDRSYFPADFDMKDPNQIEGPLRVELLRHLFFKKGELKFKAWKRRGVDPLPPVDMDVRWWAVNPELAAFEKARDKALNARPVYRAGGPASQRPQTATGSAEGGPRPEVISPYGSTRSREIHSRDEWLEDDFTDAPTFRLIPDPDDYIPHMLPVDEIDEEWPAPCLVPCNAEARAQWCTAMVEQLAEMDSIPRSGLKGAITLLAELPVGTG